MEALAVGDQALILFPFVVLAVLMLGVLGSLLWIVAKGAWEGDAVCRVGLAFVAVLVAWWCLLAWRGPIIQKTLDAAAKAEKKGGSDGEA